MKTVHFWLYYAHSCLSLLFLVFCYSNLSRGLMGSAQLWCGNRCLSKFYSSWTGLTTFSPAWWQGEGAAKGGRHFSAMIAGKFECSTPCKASWSHISGLAMWQIFDAEHALKICSKLQYNTCISASVINATNLGQNPQHVFSATSVPARRFIHPGPKYVGVRCTKFIWRRCLSINLAHLGLSVSQKPPQSIVRLCIELWNLEASVSQQDFLIPGRYNLLTISWHNSVYHEMPMWLAQKLPDIIP